LLTLKETAYITERALFRISDAGGWVGKGVLSVMVLLIVSDVILRYVFNQPIASSMELVELAMVVLVFTSIVVCTAKRGQLSIDVLVMLFPRQYQTVIDIIVHFIGAGLFGVIARQSFIRAIYLSQISSETVMLKLPYYPFSLVIAVCSVLVSLLLLAQLFRLVIEAVRK